MRIREPLTLARVRHNIAERRREARAGTRYDLAVELRSIRRVVGRVALKRVDRQNRQAELAYWLGVPYWGTGLATEAAWTLCRAGFEDLRLHRIAAGVFGFNERSVALLERIGFRLEGSFRDGVRYRRTWVPELRYGLLRGELRNPAVPPRGAVRPNRET
jgi:RimJ/RimL family protein N-acetyltransferase